MDDSLQEAVFVHFYGGVEGPVDAVGAQQGGALA